MLDEVSLVAAATLAQYFEQRIPASWLREGSFGDGEIERGQLMAVGVADQVRCA